MKAQDLIDVLNQEPDLDVILEDEWGIQSDLKVQLVKVVASGNTGYNTDDMVRMISEIRAYGERDIEAEYSELIASHETEGCSSGPLHESAVEFWGTLEVFKQAQLDSVDRLKRTLEECSKAPWSIKLLPKN